MRTSRVTVIALVAAILCPAPPVLAQGTVADYQRAMGMREKYQELAPNVPEAATWIEKSSRFWYRRSAKGGNEFVLVDAETLQKRPAFDHEKLAAALTTELAPEKAFTAVTLPFTTFTFVDGDRAIEVTANGTTWRCALADYRCSNDPPAGRGGGRGGRGRGSEDPCARKSTSMPSRRRSRQTASSKPSSTTTTWRSARPARRPPRSSASTDPKAATTIPIRSPGHRTRRRSPPTRSSRVIAATCTTFGRPPKISCSRNTRRSSTPSRATSSTWKSRCSFTSTRESKWSIDDGLFPNAYDNLPLVWRKDSRAVTFEYNQRGHQVYRVIEIDALTGKHANDRQRGTTDVLRVLRQEVSIRRRRRKGSRLDVGARRVEPPVSVRRYDWRSEAADYQGRLGRPQRHRG